jgi:uncharacterized repeat protein (TIGR01451 family)
MSWNRREGRFVMATALVLAICSSGAWASGPDVKVELQGSYQTADRPVVQWAALQEGTKVAPGDRILYSVEISNQGDREASNPIAFGPIPAGTRFVTGTATADPRLKVEYSIDGGKSYSPSPTVTIPGKDGKPQMVPAPAERYTTVRWMWKVGLPAGAKETVSYQVEVR